MEWGCGACRERFAALTDRRPVSRQPVIKSRPPTPKRAVKGAWTSAVSSVYPVCPANDANVVLGFAGTGSPVAPLWWSRSSIGLADVLKQDRAER